MRYNFFLSLILSFCFVSVSAQNNNENNTTGYIEGYYGKLLSWDNRKLIVESLQKTI